MQNLRDDEKALESKYFKISRIKTEFIDCNFSEHIKRVENTVRIEANKYHKEIYSVTLS